jgi:pilus assembly protein Flp/PilA
LLTRLFTTLQVRLAALPRRARTERGATAVEYALMLAGIAAVIIAAVTLLGRSTNNAFSSFKIP